MTRQSIIISRFSSPLFSWCIFRGNNLGGAGFWLRLGRQGPGIHIKDAAGHVMLFSERAVYNKARYFMGLRVGYLAHHRTP